MRNLARVVGCLALVLGLSGCFTVQFVEDYDPVLDQGLSNYQAEVAAFLAEMAAESGKPDGKFNDPDVQAFYARNGARLSSFVDRAEALDAEGKCLPANFVGSGIKKVVDESAGFLRSQDMPFNVVEDIAKDIQSFGEGNDETSTGNCTVVVLKVVRANHELLKAIHAENDSLPAIVGSIAGPILDQSVRIAIRNEVVKKNR